MNKFSFVIAEHYTSQIAITLKLSNENIPTNTTCAEKYKKSSMYLEKMHMYKL